MYVCMYVCRLCFYVTVNKDETGLRLRPSKELTCVGLVPWLCSGPCRQSTETRTHLALVLPVAGSGSIQYGEQVPVSA